VPRIPRKYMFDPAEAGIYHCINRCVRRAFLFGSDLVSGKCFDHRREWIRARLEFLAAQFGVDVLGFAVMSNHIHVVLRNRPDVVRGWSDEEVARRWWNLFHLHRDECEQSAEAIESQLRMITADAARLAEIRERLSSLSWFMRCLAEPVARAANREDECTGRFWEGRYKCQPILDEPALVACLAYVDLNPIRAQQAETPETSPFTSVFERIKTLRMDSNCDTSSNKNDRATPDDDQGAQAPTVTPQLATRLDPTKSNERASTGKIIGAWASSAWLSPFEHSETVAGGPVPAARASNKGCLPMRFSEYLALLDWTRRQIRDGGCGTGPADPAPFLDRLRVTGDGWLRLVQDFSRLFRRAAGTPKSLRRDAEKWGRRRAPGIARSRTLFARPLDPQRN
jgi:hypothetical protein